MAKKKETKSNISPSKATAKQAEVNEEVNESVKVGFSRHRKGLEIDNS